VVAENVPWAAAAATQVSARKSDKNEMNLIVLDDYRNKKYSLTLGCKSYAMLSTITLKFKLEPVS
jgi:hypothetical protein